MADNALRIEALCARAEAEGLTPGQMVTDAQALVRPLRIEPADPEADRALLERLGRWALGKSPLVMLDGPDSLMVDSTGASHLAGGEAALLNGLARDLHRFGFTVRIAIADTMAGAWALSHEGDEPLTRIAPGRGGLAEALSPLPISALRISPRTSEGLATLGLKRIGDLNRAPRATLTRRFGKALLERADQAFGRMAEPFTPLMLRSPHQAHLNLLEPIGRIQDIRHATTLLVPRLCHSLTRHGEGALRLCLTLVRVDGTEQSIRTGLARPSREPAHLERLLGEALTRDEERLDAGFGFEKLILGAPEAAPLGSDQTGFTEDDDAPLAPDDPALSALLDRIGTRLGPDAIHRIAPCAKHWPEQAQSRIPANAPLPHWADDPATPPPGHRPLRLLPLPEPIEAIAPVPDGPPARIIWRKIAYRIAHAEGPERLAPPWWDLPDEMRAGRTPALRRITSRDYYRLEDEDGHRFWVFRSGLYGPDLIETDKPSEPRWYLHGLFA